ncbi:MAG: DUF177 domain-containing protein [Desulfobacterales bacterium]|jgi:uncharacterized protein
MLRPRQKMKNLILHVEQLKEKEFIHEFEEDPRVFPIIAEMVKKRECEFLKPLTIRLKAFRVRELFEVQGTFWTSVRQPCSRCLKDFDSPLMSDFELTYTKEIPDMMDVFEDEEIELRAEEIGMFYFKGEEINLEHGIQEQVVMALPLQPICNDNCKGLCSQCGSDLNRGDCGCTRESAPNKFAVLKDLKLDKT